MQPLSLKGPFEPRKASRRLREMLIEYLNTHAPAVGTPFFSDNQLMEMSGLSRKAVRKAMDELQREGWVERLAGRGSFVGPRVNLNLSSPAHIRTGTRRTVRLAVLAFELSNASLDWYSRAVIDGIDEAAVEHGVSIELLGSHTTDVSVLAQRLSQSHPDVLAVMPSTNRHAFMIGEAQRRGIPCILTGTRLIDLGLPTVCEDGAQGAALAVRHLAERGHRRIGLLQRSDTAPWVFQRRAGYVQGLAACGLEHDERLVLWLGSDTGRAAADQLMAYLQRWRPTALILSSAWHARTLGLLIEEGRVRIPQDLSVISFDQTDSDYRMYLGFRPTVVEQPLRAMGRQLAKMARDIIENRPFPPVTCLPCSLAEGDSVMDYRPEVSHIAPDRGA